MNFRNARLPEKRDQLKMSAMIDVVFLLLTFFLLTFQVLPQEGDFVVAPTVVASESSNLDTSLPLHIELVANDSGALSGIYLNQTLKTAEEVNALVGEWAATSDERKVTLSCDPRLHYDHVIKTLDIVVGAVEPSVRDSLQVRFTSPNAH